MLLLDYNGFARSSQPRFSSLVTSGSKGAQEDPRLVQGVDRQGDEDLGYGIRGGEDRSEEKRAYDRRFPPAAQEFRGQDSHPPREVQDQRHLEHHSEQEKDPQDQREGLLHRRHRNNGRSPETKKEGEDRRDRDKVPERHPGKEGRSRPERKEKENLAFFPVEAGAYETPRLVEDHGACQDKPSPESQLEVGEESLGEFGENEPGAPRELFGHGREKRPVDRIHAGIAQDGSCPPCDQGMDHPLAQFFQVLGKRQPYLGVRSWFRVHRGGMRFPIIPWGRGGAGGGGGGGGRPGGGSRGRSPSLRIRLPGRLRRSPSVPLRTLS